MIFRTFTPTILKSGIFSAKRDLESSATQDKLQKLASAARRQLIFLCILSNDSFRILTEISPKLALKNPINIKSASDQGMAWCQTGDKPLPESLRTNADPVYSRKYGRRMDNELSKFGSHIHVGTGQDRDKIHTHNNLLLKAANCCNIESRVM